jgi:hypothetical protein
MEPLTHSVGGKIFPQHLPYLNSGRKSVVHCRTIDDVLRVFLYLWKSLPPGPHRLRRLKMYHSLRFVEETRRFCVFSTKTLSVRLSSRQWHLRTA